MTISSINDARVSMTCCHLQSPRYTSQGQEPTRAKRLPSFLLGRKESTPVVPSRYTLFLHCCCCLVSFFSCTSLVLFFLSCGCLSFAAGVLFFFAATRTATSGENTVATSVSVKPYSRDREASGRKTLDTDNQGGDRRENLWFSSAANICLLPLEPRGLTRNRSSFFFLPCSSPWGVR